MIDQRPPGLTVVALVAGATIALAWSFDGVTGLRHLLVLAGTALPGLPLGWRLFGRRHPAGWMTGGLIGYATTGALLWAALAAGLHRPWEWAAAIAAATVLAFVLGGGPPAVSLPSWRRRDTLGLALTLALVPALVGLPFDRIGAIDAHGNALYRSYFTADFVWHMALTSELARDHMPPRDPYAAAQPLHYYWTYFLVPAAETAAVPHGQDHVSGLLRVNALAAGLLFVGCIWLLAWAAVGDGIAAWLAVWFAVLASSLEGLYAISRLRAEGTPLTALRNVNVDAVTLWFLQGLSIDGLPRALWYTPQHAQACALGLVALVVAAAAGTTAPLAATLISGLSLGLAVLTSPFLGGVFALVFGVAMALDALLRRPRRLSGLLRQSLAALPVLLAVAAAAGGGVFAGVNGALAFGAAGPARSAPAATLVLAIGPLLTLAAAGAWLGRGRSVRILPALAAAVVGVPIFFFVSLRGTDPIWVGWRAGNLLLVTLPALAAVVFHVFLHAPVHARRVGLATCGALFLAGLPTTLIDAYNAQDVSNRGMAPGYHWTLVLTPDQQAGFDWLRHLTPPDAVVQQEPTVRGRDGWSNIPTFAQRAMAAGLPISLVNQPYYVTGSREVRQMFSTHDARRAWTIARHLHIGYVWVDQVDRDEWPAAALHKFERSPAYFAPVFRSGPVGIYAVID